MENNHDGQHWLGELSPRWAWRTVTLRDCFQNFSNPIQPCRVPQHHTAMRPSLPPNQWGKKNITPPALRRIGFAATVPLVPAKAPAPEAAQQRSDGPILRSTFHVETGSRCVSGCRFFNQFGWCGQVVNGWPVMYGPNSLFWGMYV